MSYIQSLLGIQRLLGIVLLAISTSIAAQAHHGGDHDGGSEFELITCIPELGFFEIRPIMYYGSTKHIFYTDPKVALDFHEKTGHIAHNKHIRETYTGTCPSEKGILSWEYTNKIEPGRGACGAGDWGGTLTVYLNDILIVDNIHLGGTPAGTCRGSRLQNLQLTNFDLNEFNAVLTGYWLDNYSPLFEKLLSAPITDEKINSIPSECVQRISPIGTCKIKFTYDQFISIR